MLSGPRGPHLPLALLRQYAAGTLPPEAQHRVEAHTLACARCADMLAGLLQTDAAATDAALLHLRSRLRQRVASASVTSRAPRRTPARPNWLGPQLAAAVALLLALLAGGWWAWQHRSRPVAVPVAAGAVGPTAPAAPAVATRQAARPASPVTSAASPVVPATPLGGYPAFTAYLRRGGAAYVPPTGQLTGRVQLRFEVGADGRPTHLAVLRSLRPDYDAEALRLLQAGPRWQGQGAVEIAVIF